jgi:hypothetical protein
MEKEGITIQIRCIIKACGKMITNKEKDCIAVTRESIMETGLTISAKATDLSS